MCHPVLEAVAAMADALKDVADANPTFMSTAEKAAAMRGLARLESRLGELRLRVLDDAGDVAAEAGARDAAAWLAHETRTRPEDARADQVLARGLREHPQVARGLREGDVSLAQAAVITRALGDLPREVPADIVAAAETTLVGYAATFGPRELSRLGRRVLGVVAPQIADAAEARRLAALEDEGRRKTRLTLRRQGDGTTRITGRLPDATASRLSTYLEAFTNPRKTTLEVDQEEIGTSERVSHPRKLGDAFCRLLETLDPSRLPIHGGRATTVMVTVSLENLRSDLATADLLTGGHVPGDDPTSDSTEDRISAGEARRLACTANLIPVVLGAKSQVLDLGRTRRLFSTSQHQAMQLRDRHCRAEGCDIPATWCEAHHWQPWSTGGSTDLEAGVLLCSRHHHLVHDPVRTTERLPHGDVRFHRRT